MYQEKIIDHTTGEITWRDYTKEEINQVKTAQQKVLEQIAQGEERAALRQSALAKLAALGLTEDEIAAL